MQNNNCSGSLKKKKISVYGLTPGANQLLDTEYLFFRGEVQYHAVVIDDFRGQKNLPMTISDECVIMTKHC